MSKKRTSKKRVSSFQNMQITRLKNIKGISKINTSKKLADRTFISKALWQGLVCGEVEGFKEILRAYLSVLNKEKLIQETGLSRRTLYRMLSPEGNPSLENISKIIHKLCA